MQHADAIPVRPHILVCAVCQYGEGSRPPYETDNLPEMLQFILKNPQGPDQNGGQRGLDDVCSLPQHAETRDV